VNIIDKKNLKNNNSKRDNENHDNHEKVIKKIFGDQYLLNSFSLNESIVLEGILFDAISFFILFVNILD
jgi:hypothetical protein